MSQQNIPLHARTRTRTHACSGFVKYKPVTLMINLTLLNQLQVGKYYNTVNNIIKKKVKDRFTACTSNYNSKFWNYLTVS